MNNVVKFLNVVLIEDCLVNVVQNDPFLHIAIRTDNNDHDKDTMHVFHIDRSHVNKKNEFIMETDELIRTIENTKFIKIAKECVGPNFDNPTGLLSVFIEVEDHTGSIHRICVYHAPFLAKVKNLKESKDYNYFDFYI